MTTHTIDLTRSIEAADVDPVYSRFNGLILPEGYAVGADADNMDTDNIVIGILIKNDGVIRYFVNGVEVGTDTPADHELVFAKLYIEIDNEVGGNIVDLAGRSVTTDIRMWVELYSITDDELTLEDTQTCATQTMTFTVPLAFGHADTGSSNIWQVELPGKAFWMMPIVAGTTVDGYPT